MNTIDYKETENHVLAFQKQYNARLERKEAHYAANGLLKMRYIPASEKPLTGSCIRTYMCILKIYQAVMYKSWQLGTEDPSPAIPEFESNNPQLESITGYNKRTIQRHIARLVHAGLLHKKVSRAPRYMGKKAGCNQYTYQDYTVFINPAHIVYKHVIKADEVLAEYENLALQEQALERLSTDAVTKRPYPKAKKIKRISVNAVKTAEAVLINNGSAGLKNFTEKGAFQAKSVPPVVEHTEADKKNQVAKITEILILAQLLWSYMYKRLYAHYTFISPVEKKVAIDYLYRYLACTEDERYQKIRFNDALAAIEKRAEWHDRLDERQCKIHRPSIFFGANNPKGFVQMLTWYHKLSKEKKQQYSDKYIAYIQEFTLRERRKINNYLLRPSLQTYIATKKFLAKNSTDTAAVEKFDMLALKRPEYEPQHPDKLDLKHIINNLFV